MDIFEAIKERRSVRKYKDKDVENEKIEKILEAATWAPSWANTQCWRFVVVRDRDTKKKLAGALSERNPSTDAFLDAPLVIVGCAKREVSGYKNGKAVTEKGDWYMFDVALAMQNLMLAAHSLGLGTVQVGFFKAEKVEKILNIPKKVSVVSMTPVGYPDEEPDAPERKDLDEIVFENNS